MQLQLNQLMSQLHDAITNEPKSPEVERLMRDVAMHVEQWDGKKNQTDMAKTIDQLLTELEINHPQSVGIVRKMVDVLVSIGV